MTKKLRIKKQVYYIIAAIVVIIMAASYGIKKYNEHVYHESLEYKLLEYGYEENDVKVILEKFSKKEYMDFILSNAVNKNYIKLTEEKNYKDSKFLEYTEYMKKNPRMALEKVVQNINLHLNETIYKTDFVADLALNEKILVNKYYKLESTYEPDDLVVVPQTYSWGELGSKKMRQPAYDAFVEMFEGAKEAGYYLMINMGYHSYSDQEEVYNNYKNLRGEAYADSMAARAGYSEHQTGLAIDVFSKDNSNRATFKDSETAKWLKENSYKYGFILRYPEDKVNITGFQYEPWHFRYVGVDVATKMYNENITLEEYHSYYIEK